jgi:hypothetical protein
MTVSSFSFSANTYAASMEDAMRAALQGPEKKKLRIFNHQFNVKPIEISREGNRIIVNGHISHCLRFRRDDQIYYRIIKEDDKIIKLERDINRGGWAGIMAPIISATGTYLTGVPIPPDQVENIGRSIGKAIDGSWEGACDAIIANVAIRVK